MRAARLHQYGKPLVVEEVPEPEPGFGEVLVRVEGAGFCHSDLHVMDGEIPVLPVLPHILGHENAGTVVRLGPGVEGVREGDKVVVYGGWGCGRCRYCVQGLEQLCLAPEWVGLSRHPGGYAEYLRVPHARYLVPLNRLDPKAAAPLADAALTPYRAVKKALPHLSPDGYALVIGVGGLGQYGVKLLRLLFGGGIIAVDINPERLERAKAYGADHTLNPKEGADLAGRILELTGGLGVVAAFDFVGSEETLALAIGVTATGGKVTQLGLAGGAARLKVLENSRFEVLFEATLWGTVQELREVVALAEAGRLTPIELEYHPLEAINEVAARLRRGEVPGRAVIVP